LEPLAAARSLVSCAETVSSIRLPECPRLLTGRVRSREGVNRDPTGPFCSLSCLCVGQIIPPGCSARIYSAQTGRQAFPPPTLHCQRRAKLAKILPRFDNAIFFFSFSFFAPPLPGHNSPQFRRSAHPLPLCASLNLLRRVPPGTTPFERGIATAHPRTVLGPFARLSWTVCPLKLGFIPPRTYPFSIHCSQTEPGARCGAPTSRFPFSHLNLFNCRPFFKKQPGG